MKKPKRESGGEVGQTNPWGGQAGPWGGQPPPPTGPNGVPGYDSFLFASVVRV